MLQDHDLIVRIRTSKVLLCTLNNYKRISGNGLEYSVNDKQTFMSQPQACPNALALFLQTGCGCHLKPKFQLSAKSAP